MRALLVTSQITYVHENYRGLFDALFERVPEHIAGLVLLKVIDLKLLKALAGLYGLGCINVANTMFKNIMELPRDDRELPFMKSNLPILRAKSMNEEWLVDWVKSNDIDLVINLRTRCIYKEPILSAPRLGCLNIHHGILPTYRGTLCDLYALSEDRPAGFTIHGMVKKIDAGRIYHAEEVSDGSESDYVRYLSQTAYREGVALADLIEKVVEKGALPEGEPNTAEKVVFTKTPQRPEILKLKALGMRL